MSWGPICCRMCMRSAVGLSTYGVPFLFVLSLVVFFHEFGHFLVARWCGVRVLVFSIGFGPELIGFNDRHGTRWKISAIPLGGFVKFFGDDNVASAPDELRALPTMNAERARAKLHVSARAQARGHRRRRADGEFLLAIVIFAGVFMLYGKQTMSARVDAVQPDSAAAAAGFKPGDLVVAIDGRPIDKLCRYAARRRRAAPAKHCTSLSNATASKRRSKRPRPSRRSRTISATSSGSAFSASAARWRLKI